MQLTEVEVDVVRSALAADAVEVLDSHGGYDTNLDRLAVTGATGVEVFWLKRYRTQPGHARKEWTFLGERAPYGPFDLAEPVAYIEALDAVVTRHAPGVLLSERLVEEDCSHAGAWLAALHRSSMGDAHPRALIAEDIRGRARYDAPMVESAVREWLEETADADLLRVRTHGDFGPVNIITGDERGSVIDPSFESSIDCLHNYCSRYEDVARFLTFLDDEAESRRPMMLAFVRGYASVAPAPPSPAPLACFLAKYGLQAVLDKWPGRVAWARRVGIGGLLRGWRELAEAMSGG